MSETVCPRCGARLEISQSLEGRRVDCPSCGHSFGAPIEVAYEVVSVETERVEEAEARPFDGGARRREPWGEGTSSRPYVYVWRGGDNTGLACCGCGCLTLFVLGWVFSQGVLRLIEELM